MNKPKFSETCPDCAVRVGEKHVPGCDVERCSHCGGQALAGHAGHDRDMSRWLGYWPGEVTAYEQGLWIRVPPRAPDGGFNGMPDLNALALAQPLVASALRYGGAVMRALVRDATAEHRRRAKSAVRSFVSEAARHGDDAARRIDEARDRFARERRAAAKAPPPDPGKA